jgi:penicillin amidase
VWSANARSTDRPEEEAAIGGDEAAVGAGYALGARARQIRDALLALEGPATPADMLRIQTDDRALFLRRWRTLALRLLDADALQGRADRAAFRALVERWEPRASAGSVGYALVRAFRSETEVETWTRVLGALDIDPGESPPPEQFEGALWQLLSAEPPHWLPREYRSWRDYLLERIDRAIFGLKDACGTLERCSWAAYRRAAIRHPLSAALPAWLGRILDMPEIALDGDTEMPRVQGRAFGASERFAVSPGHEAQGYLHLPGGQSGHPLSPWYRAGFEAWARGEPLPFLPGPTRERLVLRPGTSRR